jgi:hypothetical protein
MAMEIAVQRLQLGDVLLLDLPGRGQVEATVARQPERTEHSIRALLRTSADDEQTIEWPLDELVTVIAGP